MSIDDEIRSLEHQLANKREHLLLIQERKSQYVLDTDVPLEIIKEERETQAEIADLEARLAALRRQAAARATAPAPSGPAAASAAAARKRLVFLLAGAGVLFLIVLVICGQLLRLVKPKGTVLEPAATSKQASGNQEPPASFEETPQPASNQAEGGAPASTQAGGMVFAPPTLTPTPTQPSSVNLTNNREGGYDYVNLLYDADGNLHLVFYSRALRSSGDYFHMQMAPGGSWGAPEQLTDGFEILWSDLRLVPSPDGRVCVLFAGVRSREENYFERCQRKDGSFSPAQPWQKREFDTRAGFSPLILPDGKILTVYARVGGGIYVNGQTLSDDKASAMDPTLVRDANGLLHLVWFRAGDPYSLEYSTSGDGGATWSSPTRLTTEENVPSSRFGLAADAAGNLVLVWPGFGGNTYYRRWSPAGGWNEPVKISSHNCEVKLVLNATGLGRVASSCWFGMLFIEQKADGTWLPEYQVSNTGGSVWGHALAVDKNDLVTILWNGDKDIQQTSVQAGAAR